MLEYGKVTKVKGKIATVRIGRHSACGSCGMCGMSAEQRYADFQTVNTLDAKVGDTVKIDIKEGGAWKIASIAYLIPLVLGLALFVLGYLLKFPDWANLIMFILGCAIAFFILIIIDRIKKHKWMESPQLLEIIEGKTPEQIVDEQIKALITASQDKQVEKVVKSAIDNGENSSVKNTTNQSSDNQTNNNSKN